MVSDGASSPSDATVTHHPLRLSHGASSPGLFVAVPAVRFRVIIIILIIIII